MQLPLRDCLPAGIVTAALLVLPLGTAPASIASVTLLVIGMLYGSWRTDWHRERYWLLPLLLVMLLPWASLLWTINPAPGLYPYLQRSYFWLLSFVMAGILFRTVALEQLAIAFIAGVGLVTLVFYLTFFDIVTLPKVREYFLFKGYITYSLLLALATAWLSRLLPGTSHGVRKILLGALIVVNLCALAMLKSRSGYLAILVLTPLLAINLVGLHRKWLLLATGLLLSGLLVASPTVQQRFQLAVAEIRQYHAVSSVGTPQTSAGIRLTLWEGAVDIFRDHPLLGAGIDGYRSAMQRLYPQWAAAVPLNNPHNFYLYVAASYGLVGILLYGWLCISLIRKAWLYRNSWHGFMLLTTLLVVGVGSLSDVTPLQPQTGILLAMMAGLSHDS